MNKTKRNFWQTRIGFLTILTLCFWAKYMYAAYFDFKLGLSDPYQHFIVWLTPLGTCIIILSLGLYFSKPLVSYIAMLVLDTINTILLFANVIYYRQFSDFLTSKTIQNTGKVFKIHLFFIFSEKKFRIVGIFAVAKMRRCKKLF